LLLQLLLLWMRLLLILLLVAVRCCWRPTRQDGAEPGRMGRELRKGEKDDVWHQVLLCHSNHERELASQATQLL